LVRAIRNFRRVASEHPQAADEKVLVRLEELEGILGAPGSER